MKSFAPFLIPLAFAAPSAVAAAATEQETIRVTGRYPDRNEVRALRTPTPLVDVPQSVTIISRQQIDDQNFMNLGDVLRYTPGASVGQGEGHRDQITVRGQNTTADFFLDGIRDDVQYYRPLYNLERVEILRGSNALLFGRGGGGGIVNRVTKRAETGRAIRDLAASIDSFGSGYLMADFGHEVAPGQAFRLNAFYESIDNHRDFNDGDRFAVNPTYLIEFGERTDLHLSYEFVDDDRHIDRGVPSLRGRPLTGFTDTFFGDPDVNRTTLQAHILRARVEHRLADGWELDGTLHYADYDKFYRNLYPVAFDDGAGTVTLDGYLDPTQRQNLIAQGNLVGTFPTGPVGHTLLLGAEFGDQASRNRRRDALFPSSGEDRVTFPFTDPLAVPAVGFGDFVRDRASDVRFASLYFQDELSLGERWILVLGGRFDRFEIDVTDFVEARDGAEDGNDGRLARTDTEFSPRAGLIYKPMDELSFYASLGRSFLPRSGDQFLTLSLDGAALGPESFENREVGLKWDVQDRVSLTAAWFEIERENGTAVDPANPERSILTGTRTRGYELQLIGQVTDALSVNAGYSHLDGSELGRLVDGVPANRTLAQVPEHMLSLWSRYDFGPRLAVGLGVTHQASQFASLGNEVELPSFTRVDAALFYALGRDTQLQLNVENLFDVEHFPDAHNDDNITTGEPLNARLTVRHSF